jgi:hypothetical protein
MSVVHVAVPMLRGRRHFKVEKVAAGASLSI